jgi:hypothetical protein
LGVSLKYYVIQPIFGINPNSFSSTLVIIGMFYVVIFIYKKTNSKPDEIVSAPNEIINLNECLESNIENQSSNDSIKTFEVENSDTNNPLI